MRQRSILSTLLFASAGVAVLIAAPLAKAADSNTVDCLKSARQDLRECSQLCRDSFLTSRDVCLSLDPLCTKNCRDARNQCAFEPRQIRQAAIAECNANERAAISACKEQNPTPGASRDQCIDGVQVAAFLCRDNARESVASSLKVCRDAFAECVQGCTVN